jgi:PTS system nitrogen regulatory IIA component
MTIGEVIGSNHVIVGLRVADKAQLLRDLARRAATALSFDQQVIVEALQARENLGSTGLGKGFALPHARLNTLTRFFGLFVRLAKPIDFASIDGLPVDLVIMLLTPGDAGNQHLAALAALSRPLRDATFVQRLRQAPDAEALYQLLANA